MLLVMQNPNFTLDETRILFCRFTQSVGIIIAGRVDENGRVSLIRLVITRFCYNLDMICLWKYDFTEFLFPGA